MQLKYKYLIARYRPVGESYGRLTLATNVDFGFNFLPFFLKEFIVKKFGKELVEKTIETGKQFKGSIWEKKVQANPDLFALFKSELDTYLKSKTEQHNK